MLKTLVRPLMMLAVSLAFVAALHLVGGLSGGVGTAQACNPCICEGDKRMNCQGVEFYAIYTRVNATTGTCSIDAWRMNPDGEPDFVWRVTARQLARVADEPEENTLIMQGEAIALYRLTSGEYQVSAGPAAENKVFTAIFDNCPAENVREESYTPGQS
ncbi:MAG: hypothetical protein SGI73_17160 [Chloroflexota bacterium]|nr:hypothetical protein [Chloroflexota bacterium]